MNAPANQDEPLSNDGQSSRLADRFVANWRKTNPEGRVIVRDLALEPVPHLDAARFSAFLAKPEVRTAERRRSSPTRTS
jgi:FMN-dependent NADH-azoreductase